LVGAWWAVAVDLKELPFPEDADPYTIFGDLGVGLLLQWTGLLAWRRAGTGRTGPLLYLAGVLWFIGSGVPEPFGWLTFPFRGLYEPVLVAVVLGFPDGRITRSVDRALVGSLLIVFGIRCLLRNIGFDPQGYFGPDAWTNPFLLFWNEDLWHTAEDAVIVVSGICGLALAVVCITRWRRASGPARRTLTPVLISGLAIAPLLGWTALTTPVNSFGLWMPDPIVQIWLQFTLRAVVPVAILVGIVRLGTARTALADLLLELDAGVPVGGLEAAMRRQLHDPSIRLLFPRDGDRLVDSVGTPTNLEAMGPDDSVTRVDDASGSAIAYIVHDRALGEDPEYLRAVGTAARLSLENERLQAEVRAQLLEVRELSTRLVEASDSERRRVERDLHDGAQQRLVTLALRLRLARDRTMAHDAALIGMLTEASMELEAALAELRELARGIHPASLVTSGLRGALTTLAERSAVPVTLHLAADGCGETVNVTAYFVVAEALTNTARHAAATAIFVETELREGKLLVTVRDDGIGGASLASGNGLAGLRDRVVAVGGSLEVESPGGNGTTVRASVPCA
jgi:signal transduction histidine kinase